MGSLYILIYKLFFYLIHSLYEGITIKSINLYEGLSDILFNYKSINNRILKSVILNLNTLGLNNQFWKHYWKLKFPNISSQRSHSEEVHALSHLFWEGQFVTYGILWAYSQTASMGQLWWHLFTRRETEHVVPRHFHSLNNAIRLVTPLHWVALDKRIYDNPKYCKPI